MGFQNSMIAENRIEIVIEDYTLSGGTEYIAAFISNTLAKSGYNVRIVTLGKKNQSSFYPISEKVEIFNLKNKGIWALTKYFRSNKVLLRYSISMGRNGVKCAWANIFSGSLSRLVTCEHVGFVNKSIFVSFLQILAFNLVDGLVLLTQRDANRLKKFVRHEIIVMPNPSRFDAVQESDLDTKENLIIAVGRLTFQKGFDRLIRIVSEIGIWGNWSLEIYGEGEDESKLKHLIYTHGLTDRVRLCGNTKDINGVYQRAKILAMTSRFEGLPLVLIEAKSFGVACISFDCETGPREIIDDCADGYLIKSDDFEEFTKKLSNIMNNEVLLKSLQETALKNSEKFNLESIAPRWVQVTKRKIDG